MIYVASDSTHRIYATDASQPDRAHEVSLSALCRTQVPIRICAQFRNSRMIVELLEADRVVDLCSPTLFPDDKRNDPTWLAPAMASGPPPVAASVGGFHRAGPLDLATYRISTALSEHAAGSTVEELYQRHPLAPALSFVAALDPLAVGMLLGYARDPRWFVDPDHPSRCNRFTAFCGANPYRIGRIEQRQPRMPCEWRAYYLVCAWAMAADPEAAASLPGGFLYRLKRDHPQRWLVAGCKQFGSLLNYLWLNALYQAQPSRGYRDTLFLPDMVFNEPETALAFEAHIKRCEACV